jgi:hypothetical protein
MSSEKKGNLSDQNPWDDGQKLTDKYQRKDILFFILSEAKNFLFIFSSQKNQKRKSFGLTYLNNKKVNLQKF